MADVELDKLILDNLADLDATVKRMSDLETEVFTALEEIAGRWAARHGWSGDFEYFNDNFWLAPRDWELSSAQKNRCAYFYLVVDTEDTESYKPNEDYFHLTRLCRAGMGKIGFRFGQEIVAKTIWKRNFKDIIGLVSKTGFVVDAGQSLFLPVEVNRLQLAQAVGSGSIENGVASFEATLDRLLSAKPLFDEVILKLT